MDTIHTAHNTVLCVCVVAMEGLRETYSSWSNRVQIQRTYSALPEAEELEELEEEDDDDDDDEEEV